MATSRKKIRVAVLYGGRSAEHEISLRSAASVINHLDKSRFEVIPIGINKQGHWLLGQQALLHLEANGELALPDARREVILPPYALVDDTAINRGALVPLHNNFDHERFDVVFPVLHGPLGEDGTLQGLLELVDVPYVGSGVLSSAIAMDKDIAKRLIVAAGLATAPYLPLKISEWLARPQYYQDLIATQLTYPVFVKPANLGSSVGIHKVKTPDELVSALTDAFQYDVKVLVEKAINAREIELSVLENSSYGAEPLVSVPGEIVPVHEFYSYEAKYLDENGAHLWVPAKLTAEQITAAQQLAKQVFVVLETEGMARVDLFLDKDTGQFLFNEVNTIPGFTQISMYPKLWAASGVEYSELLTHLIELAVARHERKRQLKRDWLEV